MTVEECDILLDALDYTMGILKRDGAVTMRLREALLINRTDALINGTLTNADEKRCTLCGKTLNYKGEVYVCHCGEFHKDCVDVHCVTCDTCKRTKPVGSPRTR